MHHISALFFLVLTCAIKIQSSWGISSIPVEGRLAIPDGSRTGNYLVTLNGNQFEVLSRHDGTFKFHSVPSGIYLLDVLSVHEVFSQMKLKVDAENGVINVVEYKFPGAKRIPANYPIVLTAISPVAYFQRHPPFSIMGMIFANPMMLMMMFSFAVIICFPRLMAGMDEEQLKELQGNVDDQDPLKNMKKLFGMDNQPEDGDE